MSTRKKIQTRKRQFVIPKEFVSTFLDYTNDTGLEYTLSEVDEDENLIIYVEYSIDKRQHILNLLDILEEHFEENEAEDDEDESDEEEDN